MTGNKWWFTMLWHDTRTDPSRWRVSPMHVEWAGKHGGLYHKGFDTLDEVQPYWRDLFGADVAVARRDNPMFFLRIDYGPERPNYTNFQLPRYEDYDLDVEA